MTLSIVYVFVCVCQQCHMFSGRTVFLFHAYNHFNYFTTETMCYGLTDMLLSSGRLASLDKLFGVESFYL